MSIFKGINVIRRPFNVCRELNDITLTEEVLYSRIFSLNKPSDYIGVNNTSWTELFITNFPIDKTYLIKQGKMRSPRK